MSDHAVKDLTQSTLGVNRLALGKGPFQESLVAIARTNMVLSACRGDRPLWNRSFFTDDDKIRPTQRIRGLAISEDSQRIVIAVGNALHCIHARSGQTIWQYIPPKSFGFLITSPLALDLYADKVLVAFDDGTMKLFNPDGDCLSSWQDNATPKYLRFINETVAVGSDGFHFNVWNPASGQTMRSVELGDSIYAFDAHPNQSIFVTRRLKHLEARRLEDGEVLWSHEASVGFPVLALHPTLPIIAASEGQSVIFLDLEGRTLSEPLRVDHAISLTWEATEPVLWIGTESGRLFPHRARP